MHYGQFFSVHSRNQPPLFFLSTLAGIFHRITKGDWRQGTWLEIFFYDPLYAGVYTCINSAKYHIMAFIPVVDFAVYKRSNGDITDKNLQELCKEFRNAFTEVGFMYLKNTEIDQNEVCVFPF